MSFPGIENAGMDRCYGNDTFIHCIICSGGWWGRRRPSRSNREQQADTKLSLPAKRCPLTGPGSSSTDAWSCSVCRTIPERQKINSCSTPVGDYCQLSSWKWKTGRALAWLRLIAPLIMDDVSKWPLKWTLTHTGVNADVSCLLWFYLIHFALQKMTCYVLSGISFSRNGQIISYIVFLRVKVLISSVRLKYWWAFAAVKCR